MPRRSAFTLIELLIVIGILAILIAILIPSLAKARASARTRVCLANQRALGQAVNLYCIEWGNPHMLPSDGVLDWPLMLFGQGKTILFPFVKPGELGSIPEGSPYRKIMICPETGPPVPPLEVGGAHRQTYAGVALRPKAASLSHNRLLHLLGATQAAPSRRVLLTRHTCLAIYG